MIGFMVGVMMDKEFIVLCLNAKEHSNVQIG